MTFPAYKKRFFFWKVPDGWEKTNETTNVRRTVTMDVYVIVGTYCVQCAKERLLIGKENNKLFRYCPRCMIKIPNDN